MRAAVSLVTIPPVPTFEPAPEFTSTSKPFISSTVSIFFAVGSLAGFDVYNPSTSVNKNKYCASTSAATCALNVSLSPNLNSSTATVSFSFTTGIAPSSNSCSNVCFAFWYCVRLDRFSSVSNTCAQLAPSDENTSV